MEKVFYACRAILDNAHPCLDINAAKRLLEVENGRKVQTDLEQENPTEEKTSTLAVV